MGKIKKKKVLLYKPPSLTIEDRINYQLSRMNHRELKKACISRGMVFDKLIGASHHELASFFYEHFEDNENPSLLVEYDEFIKGKLKEVNADEVLFHPSLKYGFVTDEEIENNKQAIKVEKVQPKPKEIIPKTEVNEKTGVRAGTKKDYTYKLVDDGKDIEKIIKLVLKEFPDANPSSIRIWYSRRTKENKQSKQKK